MDLDEMRELLAFMEENDLVELEYEADGKRVKLRKGEKGANNVVLASVPHNVVTPTADPQPTSAPAAKSEDVIEFKSPLVGTFYRKPKPDAEPYANVGDEVTPDKVLCIVEAMKVMNEIKAETTGIIKEILAKEGQAVEFGEPLFLIQKK